MGDKVHDVVAVLGFNQAMVAGFTASFEAPILECLNHLALVDILVQTAIGHITVLVVALCISQLDKAVLIGLAVLPLLIQLLGLFFGLSLLFVSVGGLAVGGGTALELHQDVTDIDHLGALSLVC